MGRPKPGKRQRDNSKQAASSGFVVVNPSLLRSAEVKTSDKPQKKKLKQDPPAKAASSKKVVAKADKQATPGNNGTYICDVCNIPVTSGAREMHENGKKHKQRALQGGSQQAGNGEVKKETQDGNASVRFIQARDEDSIGALYYLIDRVKIGHGVIIVPNKTSDELTPQAIAGTLKHLGFTALAVHAKTPAAIRKQYADKFMTSSKCFIVTTEHCYGSLMLASPDSKISIHVVPKDGFAIVSTSTTPMSSWSVIEVVMPILQKAISRSKLALSIHTLQQEIPVDNDARWIEKLANASGLDDESKPKKKIGLTPAQQKLQALSEKLNLQMALPLSDLRAVNLAKMKEKFIAVGLVDHSASTGMSVNNTRLSAQTQWLDVKVGVDFGGSWAGPVRHGATKDKTSVEIRNKLSTGDPWHPNPQPSDFQEWGGQFGKPCGHNEVVMQHLRPFFPQEVLNARVCSREKPAPGNDGYDGCLEFIQWKCKEMKRAMTLWDAEAWIYVSEAGQVVVLPKRCIVTKPLSLIRWLMVNFRIQTIVCEGKIRPASILSSLCTAFVCGTSKTEQKLPLHVRQTILQYAATGAPDTWNKICLFE